MGITPQNIALKIITDDGGIIEQNGPCFLRNMKCGYNDKNVKIKCDETGKTHEIKGNTICNIEVYTDKGNIIKEDNDDSSNDDIEIKVENTIDVNNKNDLDDNDRKCLKLFDRLCVSFFG